MLEANLNVIDARVLKLEFLCKAARKAIATLKQAGALITLTAAQKQQILGGIKLSDFDDSIGAIRIAVIATEVLPDDDE